MFCCSSEGHAKQSLKSVTFIRMLVFTCIGPREKEAGHLIHRMIRWALGARGQPELAHGLAWSSSCCPPRPSLAHGHLGHTKMP